MMLGVDEGISMSARFVDTRLMYTYNIQGDS